jgi:hypothetical protein
MVSFDSVSVSPWLCEKKKIVHIYAAKLPIGLELAGQSFGGNRLIIDVRSKKGISHGATETRRSIARPSAATKGVD